MSNPTFAKLFERNGHQVLVQLNEDDPGITVKFQDDNAEIYIQPKIDIQVESYDATEWTPILMQRAWTDARRIFDEVTEDKAFEQRRIILERLRLSEDNIVQGIEALGKETLQ